MLSFSDRTPIYLYAGVCDMRKSFDGLLGLIEQARTDDPLSGAWFVFRNRRGDKLKIMYFDRDGLAIWYKRLHGIFPRQRSLPSVTGTQQPHAGVRLPRNTRVSDLMRLIWRQYLRPHQVAFGVLQYGLRATQETPG